MSKSSSIVLLAATLSVGAGWLIYEYVMLGVHVFVALIGAVL